MSQKPFWVTGESATLRGVGSKVFWAYPTIVVQDISDLIVLFMPTGVCGKNVDHKPAPRELLSADQIKIIDSQWKLTDVLMLIVPDEAFSTYIMWETGTKNLKCWYINLQEPLRRTSIGFDTMDNMLDVVISPDMSNWQWKDDDEFAEAQNLGLYTTEKAREIWTEGEMAVRLVTKERRALYAQWEKWNGALEWVVPKLSPLWQETKLD